MRFIPDYVHQKVVDENGYFTSPWRELFTQLLQYMNANLSSEGLVSPSQNQNNMNIIQNAVDESGNLSAIPGTLIFNTSTVNGGSTDTPNGQLYILLQDGTFHPITNT